jgi:hypothetical protein
MNEPDVIKIARLNAYRRLGMLNMASGGLARLNGPNVSTAARAALADKLLSELTLATNAVQEFKQAAQGAPAAISKPAVAAPAKADTK